MFVIPTGNDLVTFIKDFTGSNNDDEIKNCIFMAELTMRNIELPALRSDPYAVENIGVADANGRIPIPGDMNKPILFFKQGQQYITTANALGISGGTRLTLTSTPAHNLVNGMQVTGTGIALGTTITSTSGQISATGSGSSGDVTITITSPNGQIVAGMNVSGTGVGANATVVSLVGTTLTVTTTNSSTVSGTITFTSSTSNPIVVLSTPCSSDVNGTITFTTLSNSSSQTGPWIVYDRIGDRDIITQGMIAQLYLQPVNVPAVIRGKFSEVYNKYQFLPYIAEGDLINMYYYKAWPLLFSPVDDVLISPTGTVSAVTGSASPWTATLSGIITTGLAVGDEITATAGTGSLGTNGTYTIASIVNTTTITFTAVGGTIPTAGTVTNVYLINQTVQSNSVLATWPEGYVYATLREYYIKRHNDQDASVYSQKFDNAYSTVEDQNSLGKWSGGHTRLTSVWQPRQYRQYNIK